MAQRLTLAAVLAVSLLPCPARAQVVDHRRVDAVANLPQPVMDAIGQQRWFFTHASVGGNMLQGLETLHAADASRYPLVTSWVAFDEALQRADPPPASLANGTVYECDRGNPGWSPKLQIFDDSVRQSGWSGPSVPVAMNKLCFIDQDAQAADYLASMDALRSSFPSTVFVHTTIPLTTYEDSDNVLRNQYNAAVRSHCAAAGELLFDVADMESHDPAGVAQTFQSGGQTYHKLYAGYAADEGHLDGAGQARVARGWYATAAAIVRNGATDRSGDFEGDGQVDVAVYHSATGLWFVRNSSTGATQASGYGGAGYAPVSRDYDGDHRSDLAVYHAASGLWFVRQSTTGSTWALGYGGAGYTPVPRDYDGDGRADLAVYHAASGLWFVRQSTTGSTWALGFGGAGYAPVPRDYDGDGRADLAVYHEATGLWFVRQSSTGTTQSFGYGGSGFTPVPADYDGDFRADLAVYHAASGLWFVRWSSTGETFTYGFGGPGFTPVPAEYDGDFRADLAVYHAASGLWYVANSSAGGSNFAYGGSGYLPANQ